MTVFHYPKELIYMPISVNLDFCVERPYINACGGDGMDKEKLKENLGKAGQKVGEKVAEGVLAAEELAKKGVAKGKDILKNLKRKIHEATAEKPEEPEKKD